MRIKNNCNRAPLRAVANRQQWIVRQDRFDAHDDRVALSALTVRMSTRLLICNPGGASVGSRKAPIKRLCNLQVDIWPTKCHPGVETGIYLYRGIRLYSGAHLKPCARQQRYSVSTDLRVGIKVRNDHTPDSAFYNERSAWRPMFAWSGMGAWLECAVERSSAGGVACLPDSHLFGMLESRTLMKSPSDNRTVANDDGTDPRVG